MAGIMAMLGANITQFTQKMNEAAAHAKATGTRIGGGLAKAGTTAASSLGAGLKSELGSMAAGFFTISFLEQAVSKTMDYADTVGDTAKRLGISTDALQAWGYALNLNGAEMQDAQRFFETLAVSRQKAIAGDEKAIRSFQKLGVSVDDLKSKRLEDIGLQISRAFVGNDPQKLIADLRTVGGKGASALIAAFSEGMDGLLTAAFEAGVVMDESVIFSLKAAGDSFKTIIQQLMVMLSGPLAYSLQVTSHNIGLIVKMTTHLTQLLAKQTEGRGKFAVGPGAVLPLFLAKFFGKKMGLKTRAEKDAEGDQETGGAVDENGMFSPFTGGGGEEVNKRLELLKKRLSERQLKVAMDRLSEEEQLAAIEAQKVDLQKKIAGLPDGIEKAEAQLKLTELTGQGFSLQERLAAEDRKINESGSRRSIGGFQGGYFNASMNLGPETSAMNAQIKSEGHLEDMKAILELIAKNTGGGGDSGEDF